MTVEQRIDRLEVVVTHLILELRRQRVVDVVGQEVNTLVTDVLRRAP